MIILQFLLFAFWITVLPFGIGLNYNRWYGQGRWLPWLETYLYGLMTELVLFQILAICLTFLKSTLSLLTVLWLIGCGLLLASGIWISVIRRRSPEPAAPETMAGEGMTEGHEETDGVEEQKEEEGMTSGRLTGRMQREGIWERRIVAVMVAALVVFQVVFVTMHVHDDHDDAWYVGTAVISYFTDTLNRISPYSMEVMGSFPLDYTLSPWPIFCAMLGRLSFTHPAILMHTFVPIVMIPLAYVVYWLLAKEIYGRNRNQALWLLFFLCVLNIFGNWSIRSTATFLLFRIWQGKAILCNIILPLVVYVFMKLAEGSRATKLTVPILCLTVTAGTMISSMGVFLGPAMLFVLSVVDAVSHRRLRNGLIALGCVIPCVIQFGMYLWIRY